MEDPQKLLAAADKQAASASGGFSIFGGKQEKMEKAADMYITAANAFKVQKMTTEAGQVFEKAADLQNKISEPDDAATSMIEAYKAYRKTEPSSSARCLDVAIKHYTMRGNFRRAATYMQNLAELYEQDLKDMGRAQDSYNTAGEWFSGDNAEALANKMFLKVAEVAAQNGDYEKAIEKFEHVAKASTDNNLTKWSVKDYFLKAGICHLCSGDTVTTRRALETYCDMDNSFVQQREYKLLSDLVECYDEPNADKFSDCLFQYDQMSKLDKWKTTLLLKVKKDIEQKVEGDLDLA